MRYADHRSPGTTQAARSAARAVASVVRECHYASRRLLELRLYPDLAAADGDRAPDTYADFLWRSHPARWKEPSARRRAAGSRPRLLPRLLAPAVSAPGMSAPAAGR
jgi:hypothetical protein